MINREKGKFLESNCITTLEGFIVKLRNLKQTDAERMLKWMHDSTVVENLQTDFSKKNIKDCMEFIANSRTAENVHLAIVDDKDIYMGTVSLKHITKDTAEFAITVCKEAMGKGYAIWAMNEMIKKGFEQYGLKAIYWCVSQNNIRALRFYDKNNFTRALANQMTIAGGYSKEQIDSYVWYQITN